MEDLNQLKRKLDDMDVLELSEYIMKKYPENQELWYGSKKIVVRRILNFERNLMNESEMPIQ
ncbi:hypothetical protein FTO70_14275 [Methanosarcina sp. KYL-1]|uniref:hypothetical protein n=1 Tax=Methanosarcina sp. KYL-1 TaxID=2602068 RepID=UPI002100E855|nr:hypothetical protein [Methanosarcina sp. KYL-1]MCQ1536816.1 hypothetical protein [Methanosarcina sp. KYL-1]